jgi:hypothetical protein
LWSNGSTAGLLVVRLISENLSAVGSILGAIPGLGRILAATNIQGLIEVRGRYRGLWLRLHSGRCSR